jgi:hypothetical protein
MCRFLDTQMHPNLSANPIPTLRSARRVPSMQRTSPEGLAYLEANGFVTAERGAAIRSG